MTLQSRLPIKLKRLMLHLCKSSKATSNADEYRDVFSISIYEGNSPLSLKPACGAVNPVLRGSDITDVDARYVADPFMISFEGVWFMFFEILPQSLEKGVIGLASSEDGLKWSYLQVVLEEPFHLSYPYVFEFEGEHYMIPETCEDRSVRLYRAVDFPTRWEHVCNLVEGEELVDSSAIYFQETWWLFAGCGEPPTRSDTLRLFHSKLLSGPWKEHPASPIVSGDSVMARPAGRMVLWDGRLLRFTQDCHLYYGERVRAVEIHELTVECYQDRLAAELPILEGSDRGWNSTGMHHVDPHQLDDGRWFASVDGWCWEKDLANNEKGERLPQQS